MDSWIFHALLMAGLVIHGSNAFALPDIQENTEDIDDRLYKFYEVGDNSGDNSNEIESPDTTSVTSKVIDVTIATNMNNLTSFHTTNLKATPPKHSPTPKLSPGGRSHTGWLLLGLGIVLLFCTALLVSTITLACQVWKLHNQLSSVCPAHPPRVNANMIRAGKASEVMETEMEKMMEEAENSVDKTLRVDADVRETEAAAVPTAPPADPSSDCVLNV